MPEFAEALIARMAAKSWKSAHLVAACSDLGLNISAQSVDKWLAGNYAPRSEAIPYIALALGCTPNDLLGFESVEST